MKYPRRNYEEGSPRGAGFLFLFLLCFVATGIFRSTTSEERGQAIERRLTLFSQAGGISERFFHLSDSLQAVAQQKGAEYSCEDFIQARNMLLPS